MVVTPNKMDIKMGRRKSSWDSKMSTLSYGYGRHPRARSGPGSTMSGDSDIRFTRKHLSHGCRCGCAVLAGFFVFLLISAIFVYVGSIYMSRDPVPEKVFRGRFRALGGSAVDVQPMEDPVHYKDTLNLIYKRSELNPGFVISEILALDKLQNDDMMVHFNLHFDPSYMNVKIKDVESILRREIELEKFSRYLVNLTVDPESLNIQEADAILTAPVTLPATNVVTVTTSTAPPPPPRKCISIELRMCRHLPYNTTSYPNILGHKSMKEVEENMIAFRELIDAECFRNAYDFVCQLLQPACLHGDEEDRLYLPCRSYCRDFWSGCGSRLPPKMADLLDCSKFPEYNGPLSCRSKGDCIQNMQEKALSPRICDGVPDCEDLSDETSCTYCAPGNIHCGLGRACLPAHKRCDGIRDCPNGSDERNCLTIAPNVSHLMANPSVSTYQSQYFSKGYVVFTEEGQVGKLCVGQETENSTAVKAVASSLCNSLSFSDVESIEIKKNEEDNMNYVEVENPHAPVINFLKTSCKDKNVLYVRCGKFDCGKQSSRDVTGIDGLGKMAAYGDWPWHALLFKEDTHVCDATLISSEWLITTASCFQGQPKAEWMARLGAIRVSSSSPWVQERRIVGMLKSPVEGSTIALIRLEEPVRMTDFVRPICLPQVINNKNLSYCNTLGWARNRDQLQRVHLRMIPMERCENVSITTVNSFCTEALYQQEDCSEEEFAGSPIVCLNPAEGRWSLSGVSNWRIACSKAGMGRPRMYDNISSNAEWIEKTIGAIS